LVNDLRHDILRLQHDPEERALLEPQIMTALHAYAPLATNLGESRELERLRVALDRALALPVTAPERAARLDQVDASLARLVDINHNAALRTSDAIARVHRSAVVTELVALVLALLASAVIVTVLRRVLQRQ